MTSHLPKALVSRSRARAWLVPTVAILALACSSSDEGDNGTAMGAAVPQNGAGANGDAANGAGAQSPGGSMSPAQSSVGDTSTGDTSTGDTSAGDTSTGELGGGTDMSGGQPVAGADVPSEVAAGNDMPSEDMPRETPADDGPAESVPEEPVMGGDSSGAAPDTSGSSAQTAGCGAATWPESNDGSGDQPYTLDIDGTTREYYVSVPDAYDSSQPTRIVFAWHWRGGNAGNVTGGGGGGFGGGGFGGGYYGLEAQISDAIYIAAEGLTDNGQTGWANTGGRDIAFLEAMLEWLDTNYCVDKGRIFSVGFSYGGIMSDNIACQLGSTFRAIAPVAGSMFGGARGCVSEPVAAHITHGTEDTTLEIAGGIGARDYLLETNHCTTTSQPVDPSPCVEYSGCDDGYPVVWCEHPGGHTVPDFASGAIAEFFQRF